MQDHLLNIAEKIIRNSAPIDISHKYFILKEEILRKYKGNSHNINNNQTYHHQQDLKQYPLNRYNNNAILIDSKLKKNNKDKQPACRLSRAHSSSNANMSKMRGSQKMSRCTLSSKNQNNFNYEIHQQYQKCFGVIEKMFQTLINKIKLLENGQFQQLRKQISLQQQQQKQNLQTHSISNNPMINQQIQNSHLIIDKINASLLKICRSSLNKTTKHQNVNYPSSVQEEGSLPQKQLVQLVNDNKWLITSLEASLRQNEVLRRMIGKTVVKNKN